MFSKYFKLKHGTFFAEYCKEIDVFRLRPHNGGNLEINTTQETRQQFIQKDYHILLKRS